jgi:hypothetical protein
MVLRLMMLRLVMLLPTMVTTVTTRVRGRDRFSALEVDDNSPSVVLIGLVPETKFLAQLLDLRLELLDTTS